MNKLIGISAGLLLLSGAASASQMQANDTGWDVPGQHDSDTDAVYVSPQRLVVASNDGGYVDQHHVLIPAEQTASGMAELNHAGSPADSPRSGTISGISNQTMNPAVNPDRP